MLVKITLLLFILSFLIQIAYWLLLFSKLATHPSSLTPHSTLHTPHPSLTHSLTHSPDEHSEPHLPVSIIICARNEAANLKKNLHRILNQNYRSYEVIVVDDDSSDSTRNILLEININSPILRIVTLKNKPEGTGKKFALAHGIAAAKHDILLLTDADCYPNSKNWIRDMVYHLDDQTEIVLGYGPYKTAKDLLNKWIRYETLVTATLYFSFALAGMPYMGVGRNLMYRKKLFRRASGFTDHDHLVSGDDDLFINAVATSTNTRIALSPDSFVYSEGKKSWKAYYKQKARHLTTGRHYNLTHQSLLGLYTFSHFLFYLGGLVLLILKFSTIFVVVVLIMYLVRMTIIILMYRTIFKKLQDKELIYSIPLFDFCHVLYYAVFSPVLMTGNTNQWK